MFKHKYFDVRLPDIKLRNEKRLRLRYPTINEGFKLEKMNEVFQIHFGRGAGYIWGRTFYIAHNCLSVKPWYQSSHLKTRKFLQIGLTKRGNSVPY